MSFISALETFASKVEKDIEKLWSKAPSFSTVLSTTITFVGPILETLVTITAGQAAGTLTTTIVNKIQQDLLAVKGLISVIGPTPSVKNILLGVQSDLSSLLTATQVSDPKSVANINLVISELNALVGAFPDPAPFPQASTNTAVTTK